MSARERVVVVLKENTYDYPVFPFNPREKYPELELLPYETEIDPTNHVYEMIRKMFSMYNLDCENYGTQEWNPLSEIVSRGDTVVIKPNLVRDKHPLGEKAVLSTVTHSSLLRPIIDYTILALKGKGRVTICDAPFMSTNFDKTCEINGLRELIDFYKLNVKGVQVSLLDLRKEIMSYAGNMMKPHFAVFGDKQIVQLKGDPLGYTIIDLGDGSFHSEIDTDWRLYAISLTRNELLTKNLRKYHTYKKHCYFIPNTILDADVIISVPKLKSHRKAGMTLALKNFIGICGLKSFLPHHRIGAPQTRGDEYPHEPGIYMRTKDKLTQIVLSTPIVGRVAHVLLWEKHLSEPGGWYGNDTIWRTILDLNIIVKYANKKGILCNIPQRKFLFIVDGITGQEDEGPVFGYPKKCGVTLLGTNPCAVDYVAAKLVGFDVKKIKHVTTTFERKSELRYPLVDYDISDVKVVSNVDKYVKIQELKREKSLRFLAAKGWKILEEDRQINRK